MKKTVFPVRRLPLEWPPLQPSQRTRHEHRHDPGKYRTTPTARVYRESLPGLLHVRHSRSRPAAHRRWFKAGPAAHRLRHVGTGPVGPGQVQEVGAYRRRRTGQVSPARRFGLLRSHGAHGPGILLPLSADRRPGQLGFAGRPQVVRRHALYGGAAGAVFRGAACRAGRGHGRLDCELRRHAERADPVACTPAGGVAQWRHRHRGGHGYRYPAAQPQGGIRRCGAPAGKSQGRC